MSKKRTWLALLAVFTLVISVLSPFKVKAANAFTLTFNIDSNAQSSHTLEESGGHLKIDGQYVDPQNTTNYTVSVSGDIATITITDGTATTLNFNTADNYTLYANGQPVSAETNFSANTNIQIQDYVDDNGGGNGGEGGGDAIELQFDFANVDPENWTVTFQRGDDEASISMTIKGNNLSWKEDNQTLVIMYEDLGSVMFTFDQYFLKDQMDVILHGDNQYQAVLEVTDAKQASFTGLNLPSGGLHFEIGHKGGDDHEFDDTVWFFYKKADGSLGTYYVTGLENSAEWILVDGMDDYPAIKYTTKFIKASDIEAGLTVADIQDYYFVWSDKVEEYHLDQLETWSALEAWDKEEYNPEDDYDKKRALFVDPCGGVDGVHSISTNGDRSFRLTIYDDGEYYGISNASSPTDLTYYPDFWDMTFHSPERDVSGTSLSNPLIYETCLIEPKITITNDPISAPIDSITVASDILPGAVSITKSGNSFNIVFNSNFYDKVVFKVTSGGKSYYVCLVRILVNGEGCLYLAEDDTADYDVIATVILDNGTKETCILDCVGEENGGLHMKKKLYEMTSEDEAKISSGNLAYVYITAVKSGTTSSEYKGTLCGSGLGTCYRYDHGFPELDITK